MLKPAGSAILLLSYIGVVLLATQLPFVPDPSPPSLVDRIARAFNPVLSGRDAVDALRNVLLFAGWGLVWVLTRAPAPAASVTTGAGAASRAGSQRRRGMAASRERAAGSAGSTADSRARAAGSAGRAAGSTGRAAGTIVSTPAFPRGATRSILGAVATALVLSGAVETLQLFSAQRMASVLDLATNTGGALLGAGGVVVVEWLVRRRRSSPSYLGIPAFLLAGGYGAAVVLEGFAPLLRQQPIPGLWGSPMERMGVAVERAGAGIGAVGALDVVLFAPAGLLVVVALVEHGMPRSRAAALTGVLVVPVMLTAELLHGALGHAVLWAPAIAHAIAVALGGAAGAHWLPAASRGLRGRARPLAIYLLFATLLPLWAWRPFSPTSVSMLSEKLTLVQFLPLAAYRERMDVFTAVDVMIPVLILAPIGALLAVWPLRRTGPLAGLWPGVWLALVLEGGQVFVADRYFDITDLLIQGSALLVGWSVARRAGFASYGEALPETTASASPRRR